MKIFRNRVDFQLIIVGFFFFLSFFCLNGCSFVSIYNSNNKQLSALRNIELLSINNLEGAEFYQHIQSFLGDSNIKYQLKVTITFGNSDSFLGRDTDIIETIEYINVDYILFDKINGNILVSDSFRNSSSYNARKLPYQTMTILEETKKNLAINAADQLISCLTLFFFKNKK